MKAILLGPLVLPANLVFLFWGEVILNVECFADLLWRLSLDHVGNSFTTDVEESLDIQVIGSLETVVSTCVRSKFTGAGISHQNDLEQHLLVDLHELLIPLFDVGGFLA